MGTPVSSTNKTDCHYITEILLKVTLNTINQTKPTIFIRLFALYLFVFKSILRNIILKFWPNLYFLTVSLFFASVVSPALMSQQM